MKDREIEREEERQSKTERQRDRETQTQRYTETERQRQKIQRKPMIGRICSHRLKIFIHHTQHSYLNLIITSCLKLENLTCLCHIFYLS